MLPRSLCNRYARAAIQLLFIAVTATSIAAEKDDKKKEDDAKSALLTVDRIFGSTEFNEQSLPAYHWSSKRGGYTTLEKELVWYDAATKNKEVLVPAHRLIPGEDSPLSVESYSLSSDESKVLIFTNSKRVWRTRSRGDYWVFDVTSHELRKLGGDAPESSLMFAKFSPSGDRVAYVSNNNLYVQNLHDWQITALTTDGGPKRSNGTFDWVYEEELGLRDGFRWSPDGKSIAYWQIDAEGVQEFNLVNYIDGLYSQVMSIPYPKAGERNSAGRVGVVSAGGGETRWLPIPGDPREHYIAQMDWAGDSERIILQQFNRLQNQNNLIVAAVNTDQVHTVITEQDAAWVENSNQSLHWLDDHKKLIWLSERDGWQHAYTIEIATGATKLITSGNFDVISIAGIDEAAGWLYYIASPDNPTQRYLHRIKLDGSDNQPVTPEDASGTHSYNISPDAKFAIHTHSTFSSPSVVELISLPDHKRIRLLTDNRVLKGKLAKLKPTSTEFFRVDIGGGVLLDGWCITPGELTESAAENKKFPVLFFVYGEPAGQTVLDRWAGKRNLWHTMLAQQGYVVISIDNRGTPAPRGRDWRKVIYRQVGILAPTEQAAAAQALLKDRPYLDPDRIAIWGWSGGGSMTLNAIFRYPDLYRAAMSVAPVPNQRLYDSIYQERYMGLPGDNADGYRRGSAINYASQLKGDLLIVHGTGDDNVHYQGTETLVDELIVHNKQFSMFIYPSRSHSISERKNTTQHIYGLLTRYLNEKITPGSRDRK